jgi:putative ABC transport system permease protein
METLFKDLRHAVRSWIRQPAFAVVAIITLALGIGANTTIFSVVNALILNPPRINDPDRVVAIWKTPTDARIEGYVSYLDLQDWRARNKSFADIAGYKSAGLNLTESGEVEPIGGMRVTANFFALMGVKPVRGRDFNSEEDLATSEPVAVISHEFWQSRMGGKEAVLGQAISLSGKPHTVIGILPPQFSFPLLSNDAMIWTTVAAEGSNLPERGARVLRAVGRLNPGTSIEGAQAEMTTIASNLAQEYPSVNRNTTVYLVGVHEQVVGPGIRRALWLLLGAVGFILLIACTNIANLLLVRASTRQKEIALRAALGAGRWRIARQLLTESVLLALVSGTVGLLVAVWGLGALKIFGEGQLPRLTEVEIDARVLGFTFAISLFTGLLFGLVPTLKASRPDVNEVLKSSSKGTTSGTGMRMWRDSLVVSQIALSLILLVGAGLMIKSFSQLTNVPPGFDPTNVLTGRFSFTDDKYESHEERVSYVNETLARLRGLPGVESAAFVAPMPFSGGNVYSDFVIEGRPKPEPGLEPGASVRSVTVDYFQSIKIPLLKGRHFAEHDRRGGVGAAIVNQSLADEYFKGEDPLGRRLSSLGANQNEGDPEQWEIIGVVGNVHHSSLTKPAGPEIYLPYQQNSWSWGNFLIRTKNYPAGLAQSFRQEIRTGDKTVAIRNVGKLSDAISETLTESRFYTLLFGLFGAIGLVLTMTGVYGLIAYTISQRTQEIGIRMALGATRQNVVRLVLRRAVALALLGVAVGLGISFALTRVIVSLLFDVQPTDLETFSLAALVLMSAALLASYIPARKATRIDPLEALRYE